MPGLTGSLSANTVLVVGNPGSPILGITPTPPTPTSTALAGPSTVLAGESFTLTALVISTTPGTPLGSGLVTFLDGLTVLGVVPPSGGIAALTLQLPAGTHAIQAVYEGDSLYSGSRSEPLTVQVDPIVVTPSRIEVENPDGSPRLAIQPYTPVDRRGVNVAEGLLTADGAPELIVAPKPGRREPVELINGLTGAVIRRFFPFGRANVLGVSVAGADLNGDGVTEILTAGTRVGRTSIEVFDGRTGRRIETITAFKNVVHRGIQVTTRTVSGESTPEIVAETRGRRDTLVEVFNGSTGAEIGKIERLPSGPMAVSRSGRS